MGANGSKASGRLESESGREYTTIFTIGDIQVVQAKDGRKRVKLPEESHTPNRTYAVFNKNGTLKSIGVYDENCIKKYEIHDDHVHDGMHPHYHKWINGHPEMKNKTKTKAYPLTSEMKTLLNKVKSFKI